MKLFTNAPEHNLEKMKNLKEIAPGVWLCKNFLNEDDAKGMLSSVEDMTEAEWDNTHWNMEPNDQFHHFWFSRVSKLIWPYEQLHGTTATFFAPEYWITGAFRFFCRLGVKDSAPTQEEILNRNIANSHHNFFSKWRIGIYIGEFTGGEVVFPDFNDFTVSVSNRDLLVWRSNYKFSINEVTSGVRYSYSDFLIDPFDHFFA